MSDPLSPLQDGAPLVESREVRFRLLTRFLCLLEHRMTPSRQGASNGTKHPAFYSFVLSAQKSLTVPKPRYLQVVAIHPASTPDWLLVSATITYCFRGFALLRLCRALVSVLERGKSAPGVYSTADQRCTSHCFSVYCAGTLQKASQSRSWPEKCGPQRLRRSRRRNR